MTDVQPDHASGVDGEIQLVLDRAVAMVVLDLLVRVMGGTSEPLMDRLEHPAEMGALWTLKSVLERHVGETMAGDYDALLEAARARVVGSL